MDSLLALPRLLDKAWRGVRSGEKSSSALIGRVGKALAFSRMSCREYGGGEGRGGGDRFSSPKVFP